MIRKLLEPLKIFDYVERHLEIVQTHFRHDENAVSCEGRLPKRQLKRELGLEEINFKGKVDSEILIFYLSHYAGVQIQRD